MEVVRKRLRKFFTNTRLLTWGSLLILVGVGTRFVLTALEKSLNFNGYAANGAFQLLNPLRRLASGQIVGQDFNFFHGIGTLYLHYPSFLMLGSDLFASELTRWLLSPLVFVLTAYVFLHLSTHRWRLAAFLTALATAIGMIAYPFLIMPFNSILGIRSFMAIIIACLLMRHAQLQKPIFARVRWLSRLRYFDFLSGVGLALAFIMGTEFGAASIIAFGVVVLSMHGKRYLHSVRTLLVTGITAGVTLLAMLTLATRGDPLSPLKFALADLPADQFWYFGAPPNHFLHWGNFVTVIAGDSLIYPLYALFALAIIGVVLYKRSFGKTDAYYAYLFMLFAGFLSQVSMLGYYHSSQAYSLARLSTLVMLSSFVAFLPLFKGVNVTVKTRQGLVKYSCTAAQITRIGSIAFSIFALGVCGFHLVNTKQHVDIVGDARRLAKRVIRGDRQELGNYWKDTLSGVMPIIQQKNAYAIAPLNEDGFVSGVRAKDHTMALAVGSTQLKKGDVVYLARAGRQTVHATSTHDGLTYVQINDPGKPLSVTDGAPNTVIVEKDMGRDTSTVWSTYSGLIEFKKGTFNASTLGDDYIIHALGKDARKQYVDDFNAAKPDYVLTLQKPYFLYEEWLQDNHWNFYDHVLANYTVAGETDTYVIWQKKPGDAWVNGLNLSWSSLDVSGNSHISLPDEGHKDHRRVALVRVAYEINQHDGPKLYDKTTRWLLEPDEKSLVTKIPISFAPYMREVTFPVVFPSASDSESAEHNPHLDLNAYNILPFKSAAKITAAQISWPTLDDHSQQVLTKTFVVNGHEF